MEGTAEPKAAGEKLAQASAKEEIIKDYEDILQ
jgi:hypothetical protein